MSLNGLILGYLIIQFEDILNQIVKCISYFSPTFVILVYP